MKTPREILLERHQAAALELDAVRQSVIKDLNNKETNERGFANILVSLFLGCLKNFWRELIWPSRRIWAGVAAAWLVILAVNFSLRDNSHLVARKSLSTPEVVMSFQQQEQLLAELIEPRETRNAEPPKRSTPQPRSERRDAISLA